MWSPKAIAGLLAGFAIVLHLGTAALAQTNADIDALHQDALQAFQKGDLTAALATSETALTMAQTMPAASPDRIGWSLFNVAYLLVDLDRDIVRAEGLWHDALDMLTKHDMVQTNLGMSVILGLANLEAATERSDIARQRMSAALRAARGTPVHAETAGIAATFFLDIGAFSDGVVALNEMSMFDPDHFANSYGALYTEISGLIEAAEQDGRAADIATLIEAKLIILNDYVPQETASASRRDLIFQRYYALQQAGEHDRARSELLTWLKSGTPTEEDRAFVQDMVGLAVALAEAGSISTPENLEVARNVVTFARALDDPSDHRLGLVLRMIASAESHLGQLDREAQSLSEAAAILERSDEGRRHLHHVIAQMAWNAVKRNDYDGAAALFLRSDAAQKIALALGPEVETSLDLAAEAANRAQFLMEIERWTEAEDWIETARDHLGTSPPDPDAPWVWVLLKNRVTDLDVIMGVQTDRPNLTTQPLLDAADEMRAAAPPNNAEFAAALTNLADTLAWMGDVSSARSLVAEAIAINDVALPAIAPQSLEARAQQARMGLFSGDMTATKTSYRSLTEARKASAYRWLLPDNTWDFEIFAWSLLENPQTRTAQDVNEAFEALQWTQITRSAEALGLMETRLSVEDPGRGALLRQRQDLIETQSEYDNRLTTHYAAAIPDPDTVKVLSDQLDTIETDLAAVETRLNAMGLDVLGVGQVDPMSLADVQSSLRPGEMMVTFLLPSLNLEAITGVKASSNHVIGVTQDDIHIATIGEISRGGLNKRIKSFRCNMAVSETGCDQTATGDAVRGQMNVEEPEAPFTEAPFDFEAAYGLYADLFGGLEPILQQYDHLIIAPPPDLLRLPFQALVTSSDPAATLGSANWMVRRHAISVLPSISSLRTLRSGPAQPRRLTHMLGFGDPVIGNPASINCGAMEVAALRSAPKNVQHMSSSRTENGLVLADQAVLSSLSRLPDTVCELRAISAGFQPQHVSVFTDAAATETQVKALDTAGALVEYDVLVFATHGLTAGEAGAASPGLVLTPPAFASAQDDGLLSAAEIAMLDLNAELVVLSACNTAAGEAGDEDGLSGLARAFFQSGAKSLLVTHWSVYSEAAVDVTTGLFDSLNADPNQGYGVALQRATLDIIDDPHRPMLHKHPSFWAAFSMIGAT